MTDQTGPVTIAALRRVVPGREEDFEAWARGISEEASKFPGHLGSGHIRPADPTGEHAIVYRFDTSEHLDAWQGSPERERWLEASRELTVGESRIERSTGLEYWFHDPGCSDGAPPAVWKQALLTWLGLYPTVLIVAYTAGLLMASWPLPLRSIVTSGLSVLLMTWLVMPNVTRLFRGWLQRPA
jgi:antibiotic biosynthesis monooxygenase (ABM) superfamily enzyme